MPVEGVVCGIAGADRGAFYVTIKSLLISTPRPGPCGKLR